MLGHENARILGLHFFAHALLAVPDLANAFLAGCCTPNYAVDCGNWRLVGVKVAWTSDHTSCSYIIQLRRLHIMSWLPRVCSCQRLCVLVPGTRTLYQKALEPTQKPTCVFTACVQIVEIVC